MLQGVVVCCNTNNDRGCVAVCCSVGVRCAVCCSVLQCVAVCCSVLQCVAVCCSVSQCVAVRCSIGARCAVCCSQSQNNRRQGMNKCYGVASVSRIYKIIGLFAKEPYKRDYIL